MRILMLALSLVFMPFVSAHAESKMLADLFKHECAIFNKRDIGIYCGLEGSQMFLVKNRDLPEDRDKERETKRDILLLQKRYIDAGGKSIAYVYKTKEPFQRVYCGVNGYNTYCEAPKNLSAYCLEVATNEQPWYCSSKKPK